MGLQVAGIEIHPAVTPPLDAGFLPASLFSRKYREIATDLGAEPLRLAVERGDGSVSTFSTVIVPPSKG